MSDKERVLIVAAHPDDEAFGCLGTLLKHKEAGDSIAFLWFTRGRNGLPGLNACAEYFEAEHMELNLPDQELDRLPLKSLIAAVEQMVDKVNPTIVYTDFIGDLNKDHRLVSEATMVSCRPYKTNALREVWMYQVAGTTELGMRDFKANRWEPIDVEKKRTLIKAWYPDELVNGREVIGTQEYFERWPKL